jgi:hypothetical protein
MQLRFIVRGIGHSAATIWASSTETLFILFAAATGTAFVSTRIAVRIRVDLIDEQLLVHLSPLKWEHINLTVRIQKESALARGLQPTLAKRSPMYILRALVFLFLAQAVLAEQPTPILPDAKLTPGDTFDVTAEDVCVPGYAKKVRGASMA